VLFNSFGISPQRGGSQQICIGRVKKFLQVYASRTERCHAERSEASIGFTDCETESFGGVYPE
jgi:hypothetical protein